VRFAHLLSFGACAHHCCRSEGLVFLRDHTNRNYGVAATVYGGNQARGGSAGSLIVKTAESGPREACRKAHRRPTCAWGRPGAIHGVTRPGAWPLRGIPCKGLQRGLGRNLSASRYLGKNTGVIDGSLHISTLLFIFRIYTMYLSCVLHFPSLVDRLVNRIGT
jgi:hypothetical protein